MFKYIFLATFTLPFVLYGLLKAIHSYRTGRVGPLSLTIRLIFWIAIGSGILFAKNIYELLSIQGLTDSLPLSLADVVLSIGVMFSLFLILRLYSRLDEAEKRASDLHETLSVHLSRDDEKRP